MTTESKVGSEYTRDQERKEADTGRRGCSNCGLSSLSRRRHFSEKAWSVLLLWNEIDPSVVNQPVCDECYEEMRSILIERTDEIELALKQHVTEKSPAGIAS